MPTLDLPSAAKVADKIMVRHVTLDRIGLLVRYTVIAGYYETDANGAQVLNALGYPLFVQRDMIGEYEVPLTSPIAAQLIAAREASAQAMMEAGAPAMAICDDYLAQLCLDHYAATVLAPAADPVLP